MESKSYVSKVRIDRSPLWKKSAPVLSELDMELTERCNNNCIHCCINLPSDDISAKEKELNTGEIKEILKEAASLGCMSVRLTGGEPLLREDFEEIYLLSRKMGFKVLLFTNATLLTPQLAELFARVPPLEHIEVTMYGMKQKSYESVSRSRGSYESAWNGVKLLTEKGIPFIVKGTVLPPNEDEIEEFIKWTSNIPWMSSHPSLSMFFDLRYRRDKGKNHLIERLRLTPEKGLAILSRDREGYFKSTREFCSKFMSPPGDRLFSCGAGLGKGCVDAYGYFQLCIPLRHPDTVYDLKKGSIKDAVTRFFPEVRELKASNPDYLARCAKCFLKGLCEQCPAKSWTEHGTLDTPVEYLCGIAHTQARYLGLLKENEMSWQVKDWKERIRKFSESIS